jgi:hypothetical protein
MDLRFSVCDWYALGTAGSSLLWIICFFILWFLKILGALVRFLVLKYILYPSFNLPSTLRLKANLRPNDLLTAVLYLGVNTFCMAWKISTTKELSIRSASLMATNITLLLPGIDIAADALHVSLRSYLKSHHLISAMVLIQCIIHSTIELTQGERTSKTAFISGLIVGLLLFLKLRIAPNRSHRLPRL